MPQNTPIITVNWEIVAAQFQQNESVIKTICGFNDPESDEKPGEVIGYPILTATDNTPYTPGISFSNLPLYKHPPDKSFQLFLRGTADITLTTPVGVTLKQSNFSCDFPVKFNWSAQKFKADATNLFHEQGFQEFILLRFLSISENEPIYCVHYQGCEPISTKKTYASTVYRTLSSYPHPCVLKFSYYTEQGKPNPNYYSLEGILGYIPTRELKLVQNKSCQLQYRLQIAGICDLKSFLSQPFVAQITAKIRWNLATQIAFLVSELHNKNIIHYDLKPDNILIMSDDLKLQLIDLDFSTPCTDGFRICGSPFFMIPYPNYHDLNTIPFYGLQQDLNALKRLLFRRQGYVTVHFKPDTIELIPEFHPIADITQKSQLECDKCCVFSLGFLNAHPFLRDWVLNTHGEYRQFLYNVPSVNYLLCALLLEQGYFLQDDYDAGKFLPGYFRSISSNDFVKHIATSFKEISAQNWSELSEEAKKRSIHKQHSLTIFIYYMKKFYQMRMPVDCINHLSQIMINIIQKYPETFDANIFLARPVRIILRQLCSVSTGHGLASSASLNLFSARVPEAEKQKQLQELLRSLAEAVEAAHQKIKTADEGNVASRTASVS